MTEILALGMTEIYAQALSETKFLLDSLAMIHETFLLSQQHCYTEHLLSGMT